jgi:flavin reductase (DIM6/NTAB) family NADH-FMN oxidoreductase RutF
MDAKKNLRYALGCFATGITVVTAVTKDGGRAGVTVNSFNSVSLDPALILFSIGRGQHSLEIFKGCERFVVNVLRDDQRELSDRFAFYKGDRFDGLDFEEDDMGCPYFSGALARFHCSVHKVLDGGDHEIILGEVIQAEFDSEGDPLLYYRGGYRGLGPAEESQA